MIVHYVKYYGRDKELAISKIELSADKPTGNVILKDNKVYDNIHNIYWDFNKGYFPPIYYEANGESRYISFITDEASIPKFKQACLDFPDFTKPFDFGAEAVVEIPPVAVVPEVKKVRRPRKTAIVDVIPQEIDHAAIQKTLKEALDLENKMKVKVKEGQVDVLSENELQNLLDEMKRLGK